MPDIFYPDDKDNIENATFYYNRDERLKNAPKQVQDYYNGNWKGPPKGLFKVLVYTKGSRYIFAILCLVLLFCVILMLTSRNDNKASFESIRTELSAFSFEDTIYASLKCIPLENTQTTFPITVKVKFNFYDNTSTVVNSVDIEQILENTESFIRTTYKDYDIIKVIAEVNNGTDTRIISCNVQKQ